MDKLALDFPAGPTFVLDAYSPPDCGYWLIGRSPKSYIYMLDGWVSSKHAAIEVRPSDATEGGSPGWEWIISDLGSSNGTRVNGFLISPLKTKSHNGHPLKEGDKVQIGHSIMICTTPDDTQQAGLPEDVPAPAEASKGQDAAEATGRTLADVAVVILNGPDGIDKRVWWLMLAIVAGVYVYVRHN